MSVQQLPCRLARGAAGEHAEVPAGRGLELDRCGVRDEAGDVVAGRDGRDPVAAAGDREQPRGDVREVDRATGQGEPPLRQVVGAEEAVEELAECPLALVATGADRDDTIILRDPFA